MDAGAVEPSRPVLVARWLLVIETAAWAVLVGYYYGVEPFLVEHRATDGGALTILLLALPALAVGFWSAWALRLRHRGARMSAIVLACIGLAAVALDLHDFSATGSWSAYKVLVNVALALANVGILWTLGASRAARNDFRRSAV